MLTRQQLEGLKDCLPAGYPKKGGLVIIEHETGGSKTKRKRGQKKALVPWYLRNDR